MKLNSKCSDIKTNVADIDRLLMVRNVSHLRTNDFIRNIVILRIYACAGNGVSKSREGR